MKTAEIRGRPNIVGILLAGGRASRMGGGDKGLRTLGGRPLLSYAIERLAPQVGAVVLSANGDPSRFSAFGLPVVADSVTGHAGPLAGLLAGMDWARVNVPEASCVVTAPADTPFLPRDLVARLRSARSAAQEVMISYAGGRMQPVFGLWPVTLADDLRRFLSRAGRCSVAAFAERHAARECRFPDEACFFNVNTPDDLAEAERLLGACPA